MVHCLTGKVYGATEPVMALPFLMEFGRAYRDREYAENEAAQQLLICRSLYSI